MPKSGKSNPPAGTTSDDDAGEFTEPGFVLPDDAPPKAAPPQDFEEFVDVPVEPPKATRKRLDTETAPKPQSQDDDWGSYNEEDEGWNITSARLKRNKAPSTSELDSPGGDRGQAPAPRRLETMSLSTSGSGPGLQQSFVQASEHAGPAARLEGMKGADAGRTLALDRDEVTLGRDPLQRLVLLDPSTSREHARIIRDESGYVVVDNGSGNGTFVNGQRVDRSRLQHGDEVGFGSATFRFLAGGEVYRPPVASLEVAPMVAEPLWRRHKALVAAAGLAIFALVFAIIFETHTIWSGARNRTVLFERYTAGVAAFDDHQWDAAQAAFQAVLDIDAHHVRGRRYLKAVAQERKAEQQLDTAQASCKNKSDLATCVSDVTPLLDGLFRRDALALLRDVDSEVERQIARAQTALDAADVSTATTLLQNVETIRPGRPDVAALLTRASQTPVKPAPKPVRMTPKARWPSAGPVAEAVRLFTEGDVNGARSAIEKAQSDDATNLRGLLTAFKEAYEAALAQHRGKRAFNAIRLLNQAKTLEAKISAGQSKLVSNIDIKLADMYYVLGMEAYLSDKLPEATEDFRTAVGLAPDHALSMHKLRELDAKAQSLFDEAQQLKDTDTSRARSNLETVVEMLTPQSDLYRKAQARLSALK